MTAKEVKDINSYLAVIVNPRDDVRLRRIINEPARKIGMTTIDKIGELASAAGVPMMEIIAHVRDYPALQRACAPLERFYEMYRELCDLSISEPLDVFVGDVIKKSGYEAMLKAMKEEGETRLENLGQLVSSIKTYADQNGEDATLAGFLEEVALISDLDSYDNDADSVTMMTIHSAKGLEFPMFLSSAWRMASSPVIWPNTTRRTWRRSAVFAMWPSPAPKRSCIFRPPARG